MEMQRYLNAANDAARQAGQMLKDNLNVNREIRYKGDVDLVTNFDSQSQKMIFEHLYKYFPEHDFIAEEGLEQRKGGDFRWIFDPLDGTTNYAHRFPIFTVSIALEWKGEVIIGVVYDPMRDEMFSGLKGEGASLNGKRIKVSETNDLDKSLVATGFPYDLRESSDNNCGSAAMDLCYVACGRFDGFWELKLKPWDVAAAALIVGEAGGRISDFQNGEFNIYKQETLGSNGRIHQQMMDVLMLETKQKEE